MTRRIPLTFCLLLILTTSAMAGETTVAEACYKGQPNSELFDDVAVVADEGYVVGFSPTTRTPVWACYRLFQVADPPKLKRPRKKFETYSNEGVVQANLRRQFAATESI